MSKGTSGLSKSQAQAESPVKQILNFLSSMQLGLILLLLLAITSVFATLRDNEAAITTIYRSWWFIGMMAFTALNLLLCTARRIGPMSRLALHPQRVVSSDAIGKMSVKRALKMNSEDIALDAARSAFHATGLTVTEEDGAEGRVVFAQRGKFGYFGSLITHISLLLILLGAMYGSLTGFEDRNGGIVGDHIDVEKGELHIDILDVRMEQEEDPTIRPRVFTEMIVKKDGREIAHGTVSINQPLRFAGNTIYHMTFRYVSDVRVKNLTTGEEEMVQLLDVDQLQLDADGTTVHIMQFFPNFSMHADGMPYSKNYKPERPVLAGILVEGGRAVRNVFLQLDTPVVIETANGEMELELTTFQNAAVFSITRNMGRPILVVGAVLLILGLYLSFFLFPRRFWAVYDKKIATLLIGGRSYRNRLGLEQDMERIESEISSREGE
ncbi:MAG: cytochrome c biogenesis protein ResB [Firmicutes bacterium]|nr:cytochrome c biogenesis protein ResB [Bacillota bacterium]